MGKLTGKRAIVTGASRGIGRGIAIEFAKAGAEVVINFRSHPTEAAEVALECVAAGVRAHTIAADLAVQADVERLVDESVEKMGGLDIVVSNAAYSDRHPMLESDLDEFRKTIDVSMWGAFFLVRRGAQKMVDAGAGGNIVVISSPHAHMAMPGAMAYNMAKAANDQMARTAAVELAHSESAATSFTPAGPTHRANESSLARRRWPASPPSCRWVGLADRRKSVGV